MASTRLILQSTYGCAINDELNRHIKSINDPEIIRALTGSSPSRFPALCNIHSSLQCHEIILFHAVLKEASKVEEAACGLRDNLGRQAVKQYYSYLAGTLEFTLASLAIRALTKGNCSHAFALSCGMYAVDRLETVLQRNLQNKKDYNGMWGGFSAAGKPPHPKILQTLLDVIYEMKPNTIGGSLKTIGSNSFRFIQSNMFFMCRPVLQVIDDICRDNLTSDYRL